MRFNNWISNVSAFIKAVCFLLIGLGIFIIINIITQPMWGHGNDDPVHGIYEEPMNTIETLFVGASHIHSAISPMEIYEKYGICAYDISTSGMPIPESYFWIEEAYRLHAETLNTIVLDISLLRSGQDSARSHMAIDPMRFSRVKISAVKAYSTNFTNFLYNMLPLFSYHDRWKELTKDDFIKFNYEPLLFLRGYAYDFYNTSQWINDVDSFTKISLPLLILDENAEATILNETSVEYFKKIISFCEERNIRLVIMNTPTGWTSANHNAVQVLADIYGLDFIDFNITPYFSDINFNLATNIRYAGDATNIHANYYGAMKISDYLGNYLIEVCDNHDVRGEKKYAFMDEELNEYHRYIASATLKQYTDPCDYIEYALENGDYTVFISARDDASSSLTEEQKSYFNSIGLKQLSNLSYRASYLAIIEDNNVIKEESEFDPGDESISGEPLRYEGNLPDGTIYRIVSGGQNLGNDSSIVIGGVERSEKGRGLNIAIYDNKRGTFVDSATFDTHATPERQIQNVELRLPVLLENGASLSELSGVDRTLYLYDRMCDNKEKVDLIRLSIGEEGLVDYLDAFWDDKDLDIYITVKNDASIMLTDEDRNNLHFEFGLSELSDIGYQDSYIAIISGGEVLYEKCSSGTEGLEVKNEKYFLSSGGAQAGDISSTIIDGMEYSPSKNGINIVIYDNITEMVVDANSFDTVNSTQSIPEEAA